MKFILIMWLLQTSSPENLVFFISYFDIENAWTVKFIVIVVWICHTCLEHCHCGHYSMWCLKDIRNVQRREEWSNQNTKPLFTAPISPSVHNFTFTNLSSSSSFSCRVVSAFIKPSGNSFANVIHVLLIFEEYTYIINI